jgi:hypothetical protein
MTKPIDIEESSFRLLCRSYVVFQLEGDKERGIYHKRKGPYTLFMKRFLEKTYPGVIILNDQFNQSP